MERDYRAMRTMPPSYSILAVVLVASAMGTLGFAQSTEPTDPVLGVCAVRFQDDVKLPAKEAGVLVHLGVKKGSRVHQGDEIGKVDDSESKMQKKMAEYGYRAAYERAKDDVQVRFAEAASAVAKAEYEQIEETNRQVDRAVTDIDRRRAKLEWEKSMLSIEKSEQDQEMAKYDALSKMVEVEAAQMGIERRTIVAPFDGEVVDIYRKQDEWVSPGDPILRLVRLDTMYVEGVVDLGKYSAHEIQGCEVTVEVELARGRKERVRGRIVYVSSVLRSGDKCPVRAEVANRKEHNNWLLRDGLNATMTIHLKTGKNR